MGNLAEAVDEPIEDDLSRENSHQGHVVLCAHGLAISKLPHQLRHRVGIE
jgi:hypothetical protein